MKNPREFLAAGLGGVVATGVDMTALVLLVGHHVAVPVATFVAALAGAVVSFVFNKYVAFRDRTPISLAQLLRFDVVVVVGALLMAVAMRLVAVQLHVPIVLAKLMCAAIVFALWTYPTQRRLVFRADYRGYLSPSRFPLA